MKAVLQSMKWIEPPKFSKKVVFAIAIAGAGLLTFFKLKPYFEERPRVITAPNHEPKVTGPGSLLGELAIGSGPHPKAEAGSPHFTVSHFEHRQTRSGHGGAAIIERPLFDGLMVTLKAVLLNSVSSHQQEAAVEASVLELLRDESTAEVDSDPIMGAKLMGQMSVNMALKRLGFNFGEMATREGRSYSIAGSAFDPESKMIGVEAQYTSGLGSRLLGIGLDQAISLANQVGTAKVLQNSSDNSTVTQEMQAASIVVSQQASNSIANEATRDLRETPAELSLPAGTVIYVRVRARQ